MLLVVYIYIYIYCNIVPYIYIYIYVGHNVAKELFLCFYSLMTSEILFTFFVLNNTTLIIFY